MPTRQSARKRMSQSEVLNHFAEKTGMNRVQVKEFFDELYNLASREVQSNGEFLIPGLGKLVKSERKKREGRNPATGETIQIPAKTTLKFRVGKSVKRSVLGDPYTDAESADLYTDAESGDPYTDPELVDPYTKP